MHHNLLLLFQACKELLFPSHCLACKRQLPCRELPLFCCDCLARIKFVNPPVCTCCGTPFPGGRNHYCGHCLTRPYGFQSARSAVLYDEPVAPLISNLKFRGDLSCLSTLTTIAKNSPGFRELSVPDIIIPIPLHIKRLRKRGFNQALIIAESLFPDNRSKIQPELLIRNRATPPQTGLSGSRRRKNLKNAFSAKRPQIVSGKKILLIDDVLTTGSTVDECSRILSRSGAGIIEVFTLARAL